MRLVIPPEDPDLDGVATAFAYAEYLKKNDHKAVAAVFGSPDEETEELFDEIGEEVSDASYYLYSADEITLVSASSMENVSQRIHQEKVTELIDHAADALSDFTEAEQEIDENFSTAAGIVAEKYRDTDTEISREAATVLHHAITSAGEVTQRDQEIADWLQDQLE
ncbi:MAG: hypothetical protein ABEJ07_02190 [Candidatus Nanohaloarchaea archaeon]